MNTIPKRFIDEKDARNILISKEGINQSVDPVRKNTLFMTRVKTKTDMIKRKME